MKQYIFSFIFLLLAFAVRSQTKINNAAIIGTWQSQKFMLEDLYTFDAENNELVLGEKLKYSLTVDKNGELKNSLETLKKQLSNYLYGTFFTFNENDTYTYVTNGVNKEGSFSIQAIPDIPGTDSRESNFLEYIDCYRYNGMIVINDSKSEDRLHIKIKVEAGTTQLSFSSVLEDFKSNEIGTFVFKKVSEKEAAHLIKGAAEARVEEENKEKAVAAEKLKQEEEKERKLGPIITRADKEPSFPGGDVALNSFIVKNLFQGGNSAEDLSKGKYNIEVSFVVNKDGSVANVIVNNDAGKDSYSRELLNEEYKRIFLKLPPWIPAEINGQKVRFQCKKSFPLTKKGD
jgi:hypothetical protein